MENDYRYQEDQREDGMMHDATDRGELAMTPTSHEGCQRKR